MTTNLHAVAPLLAVLACGGASRGAAPSVTVPTFQPVDAEHGILFAPIDDEHTFIAGIDNAKGETWSKQTAGGIPLQADAWADSDAVIIPLTSVSGGIYLVALSPRDGHQSWQLQLSAAGHYVYAGVRRVGDAFYAIAENDTGDSLFLLSHDGKIRAHWDGLHPDHVLATREGLVLGDPAVAYLSTGRAQTFPAKSVGPSCVLDDEFVELTYDGFSVRLGAVAPALGPDRTFVSEPLGQSLPEADRTPDSDALHAMLQPTGLLHCGHHRGEVVALFRELDSSFAHTTKHSAFVFLLDAAGHVTARIDLGLLNVVWDGSERHRLAQLRPFEGELPRYLPVLNERGQLAVVDLDTKTVVREGKIPGKGIWNLTRTGAQYVMMSWWATGSSVVALDGNTGEVTAAVSLDGQLDIPSSLSAIDGRVWLGRVPKGATPADEIGLAVLDARTLQPVWSQNMPLRDETAAVKAAIEPK